MVAKVLPLIVAGPELIGDAVHGGGGPQIRLNAVGDVVGVGKVGIGVVMENVVLHGPEFPLTGDRRRGARGVGIGVAVIFQKLHSGLAHILQNHVADIFPVVGFDGLVRDALLHGGNALQNLRPAQLFGVFIQRSIAESRQGDLLNHLNGDAFRPYAKNGHGLREGACLFCVDAHLNQTVICGKFTVNLRCFDGTGSSRFRTWGRGDFRRKLPAAGAETEAQYQKHQHG